jgi:hypothetical protein
VSNPWARPHPDPTAVGTPAGRPAAPADALDAPPVRQDVQAGLLTVAVTVLVGAPVGLLWAALAPRVEVVLTGEGVQLVDRDSSAFIASDGYFSLAVLLAGLVGGALAWRWGSRHGPTVVPGLAIGGLIGAYVAMAVGGLVGDVQLADLLEAGAKGRRELGVRRLRSLPALLVWPAASVLSFLTLMLRRPEVSSGSPQRAPAQEPASR